MTTGKALHADVTLEAVEALARRYDNEGMCLGCGNDAYGVEPDAERYTCEACGEPRVYGAEQLLVLGLYHGGSSERERMARNETRWRCDVCGATGAADQLVLLADASMAEAPTDQWGHMRDGKPCGAVELTATATCAACRCEFRPPNHELWREACARCRAADHNAERECHADR